MPADSAILPLYGNPQIELVQSGDCTLQDAQGRRYIDFESGVWVTHLGHNHPEIRQVCAEQMARSIHHGYKFWNRQSEALSLALQGIMGISQGQSVFLSSGSESIELAIRLAMHLTGRGKILRIDQTFLSAYGRGRLGDDNPDRVDVALDRPLAAQQIAFEQIAALVLETGGASGAEGVQFPDAGFLEALARQGRQHGCLIIFDEVTTGMGRTGQWFSYMHYAITPDIVVTGKALGNGYPISAVTVQQAIAEQFSNNPFRYAQSHQNDPLGCAIGLKVIEIMQRENHVERAQQLGQFFLQELQALQAEFGEQIEFIRARGLMLGLRFTPRVDVAALHDALFANGWLVGQRGQTLRFMPPLSIAEDAITGLCAAIRQQLLQPACA